MINIPETISIDRLKEISEIWNQLIACKSQITGSFITAVLVISFPITLFFLNPQDEAIRVLVAMMSFFGMLLLTFGFFNFFKAKKLKNNLNSFNGTEIAALEEIVDSLEKIKPNSLEKSFQFFHSERRGKSRKTYSWVVYWDNKNLYILRKPKKEIHICHTNSFTIEEKGKMPFSNSITAAFSINNKTVLGWIDPQNYNKYKEWKHNSSVAAAPAASSAASSLSSPSNSTSTQEHRQDDEIYKVDF